MPARRIQAVSREGKETAELFWYDRFVARKVVAQS
jgi:hypothetical protein